MAVKKRNSIEVSRQQVFLVTLDGLPLAEYLKLTLIHFTGS